MSMADNLFILEHDVETGLVTEIPTTEQELNRATSDELLEKRESIAAKQAARKAVFQKLGLTEEEIALIS